MFTMKLKHTLTRVGRLFSSKKFQQCAIIVCVIWLGLLITAIHTNHLLSNKKITNTGTPSAINTESANSNTANLSNANQQPIQKPSGSSATNTHKPYIASVCTTTLIPYQTSYQNVSWLPSGQTQSYGGTNGSTVSCTTDSNGYKPPDSTLQPYNKTVYLGTGTTSSSTPSTTTPTDNSAAIAARQARIQSCLAYLGAHGAGGSSATEQCYQIQ